MEVSSKGCVKCSVSKPLSDFINRTTLRTECKALRYLTAEQNLKKGAKLPLPGDKFKMIVLKCLFIKNLSAFVTL